MLDRVMLRLAQRPSRGQVEAEVAAWRAAQPMALAAVSRHVAEGLMTEVVDEMIAKVGPGGRVAGAAGPRWGFEEDPWMREKAV